MSHRPISIAFSPDTDDAFMVHAMRARTVDLKGYEFTYTSADIQTLNEAAQRGVYDVTAISIAAYPSIAEDYWLMPVGASIGDAFGPALIVTKDSPIKSAADLAGRRIAVPGLQTSAFFAARALIGPFQEVPLPFKEIGPAVMRGDVDAGILIHELQLVCEEHGFRKVGDLGLLWSERYDLPLPLGANAIKRSLGATVIAEVTAILRASIETGLADRVETLGHALAHSKAGLDLLGGDKYISMYVNDRSLRFAPDVRRAVGKLLGLGATAGLCQPCELDRAFYEPIGV